jgi:hypothetical protein
MADAKHQREELKASQQAAQDGIKEAEGKDLASRTRAEMDATAAKEEARLLKEQGIDPQATRLDEIEEGGRYIMGNHVVNANGEHIS